MPAVAVAWAGYLLSVAAFVYLGLRDPDATRRGTVWPMAGSFAGLAVLEVLRSLTDHAPFAAGPGIAAWLVLSALLATAGRPTRLAVGTQLDPVGATSVSKDERLRATSARRTTVLLFLGGISLGAAVWLVLLR